MKMLWRLKPWTEIISALKYLSWKLKEMSQSIQFHDKLLLINYKWKLILRISFFNHLSDTNKTQTIIAFLLNVSGLTMLRAEKFLMGSSAARETELSMMKTRMRLVNMWWLMSLWQNTRTLQGRAHTVKRTHTRANVNWLQSVSASYGLVLLKIKNALPSGMGVIFSFFTRSEMTGRGPDGTSGSSSSPAVSSLSSSSSWGQAESQRTVELENRPSGAVSAALCWPRIPCRLCHLPFCLCDKHRWVNDSV